MLRYLLFLQKKVAVVHDSLEAGFKPEERYNILWFFYYSSDTCSLKSAQNSTVKAKLIKEITTAHSDKYKESDVSGTVLGIADR